MLIGRVAVIAVLLGCFGCAALQPPDPEAKLRDFAGAELLEAQRLLQLPDEQQGSDRISAALQHLAGAEAVLILPRDTRIAAGVQVWTGIAHMKAGRTERAHDHFAIARDLFASIGAEHEAEGVAHLLRR